MRFEMTWIVVGLLFAAVLVGCGDVGDAPVAQTGAAAAAPSAEGTVLAIDRAQSEIGWRAAKVTRAHEGGFRSFSGQAFLDEGEVTGLELAIETASIWSDTDRLTEHLKDADFFDVATFPTAEFQATDIVPSDSAGYTHTVTGNLTMHGEVRSISFPATITVGPDQVRAVGDFIIDRRDWGINYKGQADDLIRNDVRILFDVAAGHGEGHEHPGA